MIRLWQQKSGNSRLILRQILFGKFQISAHSYRQTIPTFQAAKGTLLLPGRAGDVRQSTRSRDGCGLMSLSSGEARTPGVWAVYDSLAPLSNTALSLYRLKDAVVTKPLSLFALDHKLKISRQSKSQHILTNFPIVLVFFFFFAGRGGLSKKKRAPEERRSTTCLDAKGRTVLIKRTHWLKSPNTKYLEP